MRWICVLMSVFVSSGWALDDAEVQEKVKALESPYPTVRAAAVEAIRANKELLLAVQKLEIKSSQAMAQNEIGAAQTCLDYAKAQATYFSQDRDGDGVTEYAESLASLLETKAGSADLKLIDKSLADAEFGAPNAIPKMGYFFKILKGQGALHRGKKDDPASKAARSYIVDGNMTGGFAILAIPAVYGVTGRVSFMLNSPEHVFQRDLGKETNAIAETMKEFDPGTEWVPAE